MKTKIAKEAILQALGIWGILSIIVLAGEDIPGEPMSDAKFYGTKIAAIVSFALCLLTGRYLNRKGMLPDVKEEEENDKED